MHPLLLCLTLIVLATGCDSSGDVPVVDGRRSFTFARLPDTLRVDLPGQVSLSLASYAQPSLPAVYTVRPTIVGSATATAAVSTTDGITVTAQRAGTATLSVLLSAPSFRDTTLTFVVVVQERCPPAAATGLSDLFPITAGAEARFSYAGSYFERSNFPANTASQGTLTTTLSDVSCRAGERLFLLAYQYTGTATTTIVGSPAPPSTVPVTRSGSYALREDAANRVTLFLPALSSPFRDSTALTFTRFAAGSTQTGTTEARLSGTACAERVVLQAGIGIASTSTDTCYMGFGYSASRQLSRLP